jgi:hypothetical protein
LRKQLNLVKSIENHIEEAKGSVGLVEMVTVVRGVKVIGCIHQNVVKWLLKNNLKQ